MPDYVVKALFVTVGLILLIQLGRLQARKLSCAGRCFRSAGLGLTALLVGNMLGFLAGLGLGLNALTIPVAAGLGLPGLALLWALRYLL
jgi:pro-sigmaK processing inhibitor BofA